MRLSCDISQTLERRGRKDQRSKITRKEMERKSKLGREKDEI